MDYIYNTSNSQADRRQTPSYGSISLEADIEAERQARLENEVFCDTLAFAGTCLMLAGAAFAAGALVQYAEASRIRDISAVILFSAAFIAGAAAAAAGTKLAFRLLFRRDRG